MDDADLYTSDDTTTKDNGMTDPIDLWHKTQGHLDQWSNLLQASGGALKPEKCFWYSLLTNVMKDIGVTWILTIMYLDGTEQVIEQKAPTFSMETVGVMTHQQEGTKGI